jgi:hypothetical protein
MLTLAIVLQERIVRLNWLMVKRGYWGYVHNKGVAPEMKLDDTRKPPTRSARWRKGALVAAEYDEYCSERSETKSMGHPY